MLLMATMSAGTVRKQAVRAFRMPIYISGRTLCRKRHSLLVKKRSKSEMNQLKDRFQTKILVIQTTTSPIQTKVPVIQTKPINQAGPRAGFFHYLINVYFFFPRRIRLNWPSIISFSDNSYARSITLSPLIEMAPF